MSDDGGGPNILLIVAVLFGLFLLIGLVAVLGVLVLLFLGPMVSFLILS